MDSIFMKKALALAKKASRCDEVPVGAVVVDAHGVIIGRGSNKTIQRSCQTGHAEIIAIEQAGKKIQDWRLTGCTLYVTLEPCILCLALIRLSRISRLVYGAPSPLFGQQGSGAEPYAGHLKDVQRGLMAEESVQLLKQFFKTKRIKTKKK